MLNPCVTVNFGRISRVMNIYAKLGKKYLNASRCKFVVNSLQHSESFDVSQDFLPPTVAELSTLKQVHFFGSPCSFITLGLL